MIHAVIFDVDGTLVDSVEHEIIAWHEALVRSGFDVARDAVRNQMGKGADQLLPFLLPHERKATHDRIADLQGKIFHAQHRPEVRPFPMVAPLFRALRQAGIQVALGSSGDQADIEHYQRLTGTADLVDVIACIDDVQHSKPAPDIFEAVLDRLGSPSVQRVLAVGDTIYDVQAASVVGLRTIGVLGGAFDAATLRQAGCIAVYRDVAELYENRSTSPLALHGDGNGDEDARGASPAD
ncbi:MAG: family hydrolase [Rhodospirillales bacterium]|nr:family hydrolase [Rhodospirillales bacterium]